MEAAILVAFLTLTFGHGEVLAMDRHNTLICGMEKYNKETAICCNSTIHDKYNKEKQVMGCCRGKDLYSTQRQFCCGNHLIDIDQSSRKKWNCCGNNKPYENNGKKVCCGDTLVKILESGTACCGKTPYNRYQDTCCEYRENGTFRLYPGQHECCGSNMFNRSTHYCVKHTGTVVEIGISECNGQMYNTSEKVCCEDTVVSVEPYLKSVPKADQPIKGEDEPYYSCFDGIVFDSSKEKFIPANKKKHFIAHTIPKHLDTCGNGSYNRNNKDERELCCGGQVFRMSSNASYECCGAIPYNSNTQKCCKDKPYNKAANVICCDNKLLVQNGRGKRSIKKECCGYSTLYDPEKELCCAMTSSMNVKISKLKANDSKCCFTDKNEIKPFNEFSEVCLRDGPCPRNKSTDGTRINGGPFCRSDSETRQKIKETCDKKFLYKLKVNEITPEINRDILNVTILEIRRQRKMTSNKKQERHQLNKNWKRLPLNKKGTILLLKTKYNSDCIKTQNKYFLITNRKNFKQGTLRVNASDLVIEKSLIRQRRKKCRGQYL